MDLFDIVRALLRQWKVAVVGVVALFAAAAVVILLVPTTYQATGRLVLLLPPNASSPGPDTNPYLNVNANMSLMASLAASSLVTTEARDRLADQGYRSPYAVSLPPEVGPVLDVSVRDSDPAAAVRTRDVVMQRLTARVAEMQGEVDAPKSQTVYTRKIATPSKADALPGAKIRALAVAGALIVVLTLMVAMARDRRQAALKSRKESKREDMSPSSDLDADLPSAVAYDVQRSPVLADRPGTVGSGSGRAS